MRYEITIASKNTKDKVLKQTAREATDSPINISKTLTCMIADGWELMECDTVLEHYKSVTVEKVLNTGIRRVATFNFSKRVLLKF